MNQWRSPTAEKLYRNHPSLQVRSGGTSPKARHSVTKSDLDWADAVMVMERKHVQRLRKAFPSEMMEKTTCVLDIEDLYQFMDSDLVEELKNAVDPIIEEWVSSC